MNNEIAEKDLIIRILHALLPGVKLYLFGSRARGRHTPRSDIDLALDLGRRLTLSELAMAMNIVEDLNIPCKVDIVDIHRVSESMRESILKEGVLWKSLSSE